MSEKEEGGDSSVTDQQKQRTSCLVGAMVVLTRGIERQKGDLVE